MSLTSQLRASPDDHYSTSTSYEQKQVEIKVFAKLSDWEEKVAKGKKVELTTGIHVHYLIAGLNNLSRGHTALDASRPWLVYWILHSLEVLGALKQIPQSLATRCIDFLSKCQHRDGGYGGGPHQEAHLAPTYAAISALSILAGVNGREDAMQSIDRVRLYAFLKRVKDSSGGFKMHDEGEVDTRGCYTALVVANYCNIITPELVAGTAEWLASCQTYEGGMGGEPGNEAHGGYTYCAVAGLMLLDKTHLINLPRLIKWTVMRQMSLEGGFQGRSNKLVDGCYSFWVGSLFPLIDMIYRLRAAQKQEPSSSSSSSASSSSSSEFRGTGCIFDNIALQKYILFCCQDFEGGLIDKPGKSRDFYHTCYCLSGLAIAQFADYPTSRDNPVGGKASGVHPVNPVFNIGATSLPKVISMMAKKENVGHLMEVAGSPVEWRDSEFSARFGFPSFARGFRDAGVGSAAAPTATATPAPAPPASADEEDEGYVHVPSADDLVGDGSKAKQAGSGCRKS